MSRAARLILALAAFTALGLSPPVQAVNLANMTFGVVEELRFVQAVELKDPNGMSLVLARRLTTYHFFLPWWTHDGGFVLGKVPGLRGFHPLPPPDELKRLQQRGLLPSPLPTWERQWSDYRVLQLILPGLALIVLLLIVDTVRSPRARRKPSERIEARRGLFDWLFARRSLEKRIEPTLSSPPSQPQAAATGPSASEITISCPKCRQQSKHRIHNSVDGAAYPQLEAALFSGQLFAWRCAACSHQQHFPYPLIYYHPKYSFMMLWYPALDLTAEMVAPLLDPVMHAGLPPQNMRLRIVVNHADLVEKARVFAFGLDDRIVEWFKYCAATDVAARPGTPPHLKAMLLSRDAQPRFVGVTEREGKEVLVFSYPALAQVPGYAGTLPAEKMNVQLSREQYDRLAKDADRIFPMPRPLYWQFTVVDYDAARALDAGAAAAPAAGSQSWPERAELERLRYLFEHFALRTQAFENHPELLKELEDPDPRSPFIHAWSMAQIRLDESKLPSREKVFEWRHRLAEQVRLQAFRRGGYTVYAVTMPPPEKPADCHFVAVVHSDAEAHEYHKLSPSTRYFTFEMNSEGPRPMLCEWRRDGERENYGAAKSAGLNAFVDAVFDLLPPERAESPAAPPDRADAFPLTMERTHECTKCRHVGELTIYRSVNANWQPALAADLLSMKLFHWRCRSCGQGQFVNYPMLYHEPEHRFMLLLFPYRDLLSTQWITRVLGGQIVGADIERYRFRIVIEHADLVEKARVLESGLDDRAVEWFKFSLAEGGRPDPLTPDLRKMMLARANQPRFVALEQENGGEVLVFSHPAMAKLPGYPVGLPPELLSWRLGRADYNSIAGDIDRLFPAPAPIYSRFTRVDHDVVRTIRGYPIEPPGA